MQRLRRVRGTPHAVTAFKDQGFDVTAKEGTLSATFMPRWAAPGGHRAFGRL
jgi:hypothetical protein